MEIKNHILQGVEYKESPNKGGVIVPKYLIQHFTASANASGAISWMTSKESEVSAHLHLDREGKLVQLLPFNIKAWHAGKDSKWREISGLNSYSIGIEIQNTGSQEYTEKQMNSLIEVSKLLKEHYSLKEIVGHEDISPIRKSDPSGVKLNLFNWVALFRGCCIDMKVLKATAELNIRRGQGTTYPAVIKIPAGTEVYELNKIGEWTKIQVNGSNQSGWVSNAYLA